MNLQSELSQKELPRNRYWVTTTLNTFMIEAEQWIQEDNGISFIVRHEVGSEVVGFVSFSTLSSIAKMDYEPKTRITP